MPAFWNPVASCAQDARAETTAIFGDCQTTAQKFAVATAQVNSKPNSVFSNLPENISFVQSKQGCVMVTFAAESHASVTGTIRVRATLDNMPVSLPAEVHIVSAATTNTYGAQAVNFIFSSVAAGRHSLRIQIASGNAMQVSLFTRSIIVGYMK
jgi:hypothetical protein